MYTLGACTSGVRLPSESSTRRIFESMTIFPFFNFRRFIEKMQQNEFEKKRLQSANFK